MQSLKKFVLKKSKLDEEEKHKSNKIIEFIREVLLRRMCENNDLFNAMYRELYYTGSSYDGLKICEPDEYDLNLILRPKIPELNIYHVHDADGRIKPGYVLYGFHQDLLPEYMLNPFSQEVLKLTKLYGERYVMDPNKFKSWVVDIFTQSLSSLRNQFGHYGISDVKKERKKRKGARTAITLNILLESGLYVDVDLVPVFSFKGKSVKKKHYQKLWKAIRDPK